MKKQFGTDWVTMDGLTAEGIRWKLGQLAPSDSRREQLLAVLPIFDSDGSGTYSDPGYSAIESLTGSHPAVPRKSFSGNPLLIRGDAQRRDTHIPRQEWASPLSVFEGVHVDFSGCTNMHLRLVRMAEAVGVPINVTACAVLLIARGLTSTAFFPLRNRIGRVLATSDDFERVRNGFYQLKSSPVCEYATLMTPAGGEHGGIPLK